jgi:hypothetical protein
LCFVVIFSAFFLVFSGRVCSVVGASVFADTIYRCGARHSHRCNLPDHIPSSLHSSYSFLRFILADTLSALQHFRHTRGESEWLTRSRSPKHRRGENEWISLRLLDSPTFSSISRSACFGDLQASTSAHHDVYTGGNLLHITQYFQGRTSTYGFHLSGILFGATFFS